MKESSLRSFPNDKEKNPKEWMSITLRSGKELGDSKVVENEKLENEKVEVRVDKTEEKDKDKFISGRFMLLDNPPLIVPHFPFSQRFKKAKLEG